MQPNRFVVFAGVLALSGLAFTPTFAWARDYGQAKALKAKMRDNVFKKVKVRGPKGAHFITEAPSGMMSNWAAAVAPGVYHSATTPRPVTTTHSSSPY
jgi:hypothetical protein